MMQDNEKVYRIARLLAGSRVNRLTDDDVKELEAWRKASPENEVLYARWEEGEFLEREYRLFQTIDREGPRKRMEKRIARVRKARRRASVLRWSAVAAAVLLLVCSVYWLRVELAPLGNDTEKSSIVLIQPRRPMLQLGDGSLVVLDTVRSEFSVAGVTVKKSGETTLSYTSSDSSRKAVAAYNTLKVPCGAEYDLVLADGTHVWLNADSKLKYPVTFTGKTREVELEGEAYFEVKRDEEYPFRVKTKGQLLEVLGTSFNVDAYAGNEYVYTTLVSGKVRVDAAGRKVLLTPGMQSVAGEGKLCTRLVDVDDVISWREGMFVLEEHTLGEIMEQMARWYDFDIFYQNAGLREIVFKGKVPRYDSFESILSILERTGEARFKISDKTVTVYK